MLHVNAKAIFGS